MAEIGNINDEITEVKAFIDEQDRQFLERKDDPGEAKDKAAERGNTLMKGGSIALSAQEVRRACILPASPSRWRPPRWWNPRARAATSATASAIWSAPSSTRSTCRISTGMGSFLEPYVISELDAKGEAKSRPTQARRAPASSVSAFGVAKISPYELNTTSYVDRTSPA